MKRTTKLIALLLALVLVLALCACGQSGEKPKAEASSAAPGAAADPGAAQQLPITAERSSFTVWFGTDTFFEPIDQDLSRIYSLQQIEEKTNVYIEFTQITAQATQEQFPIMVASADWCDCISQVARFYAGGIDKAVEDEVIQDITKYINDFCPNLVARMNADETLAKGMLSSAGYITYFPTLNNKPDPGPTNGYVIRQDWLDKLNLSMPKTYDQLHDVLTAFKNEYDATLFVAPDFVNIENDLAAGFDINGNVNIDMGAKLGLMQIDGVVTSTLLRPENYKAYLTLMNQWWNEGLVDDTYNQYFMEFLQDHFGGLLDGTNGVSQADSDLIKSLVDLSDDPDYRLVAMADVGQTEGQTLHFGNPRTVMNGGSSGCWFITTTAKDPELITRFCNYLYSDEAVIMCNYGTEGYTYNKAADGSYEYTDLITKNPDGFTVTQMLNSYLCHNNSPFPVVKVVDREFYNLTEDQYNAIVNIWPSNNDCAYNIPFYVLLNGEETAQYNELAGDLSTYVSENHLAFITGAKPFSEFDAFVEQCKQLGIEKIVALYQAAWDRTMK